MSVHITPVQWVIAALRRPWNVPTWLKVSPYHDTVMMWDFRPVVVVWWDGGHLDPRVLVTFRCDVMLEYDGWDEPITTSIWDDCSVRLADLRVPTLMDMPYIEAFEEWAVSVKSPAATRPRVWDSFHYRSIRKALKLDAA